MFMEFEHALIKRGYRELENTLTRMVYVSQADALNQVTVSYDCISDRYSLSFPLNNSQYNCLTFFDTYEDLKTNAMNRVRDGLDNQHAK